MKVISEITDEFIEVPENRDLVVREEMNAITPEEVLKTFVQISLLQDKLEEWKTTSKEQIIEIFKKYGVKSFSNDFIQITYKAPYTKKVVDTKKMKEDGVYELYLKDSTTKETIVFTPKGGVQPQ